MHETVHRVERVYSVLSTASLTDGLFLEIPFRLQPSRQLLEELSKLKVGTIVGLELCNPAEIQKLGEKIGRQRFKFDQDGTIYWQPILNVCSSQHLPVVYLDDFKTHREVVQAKLDQNKFSRAQMRLALELDTLKPGDPLTQEYLRCDEDIYGCEVEVTYLHQAVRAEKIMERIARFRPQVVILNRGNADYFVSDLKQQITHGVMLLDYQKEEPSQQVVGSRTRFATLLKDPQPDPGLLLERELLTRQWRAVVIGRILDEKTPDLIGTWNPFVKAQGLFEVFIKGQAADGQLRGVIEDRLGTADFAGTIDKFVKSYRPDQSAETAIKNLITYQGECQGNVVRGTFDQNRGFIMNEGAKLLPFDPSIFLPINSSNR